MTAKKNYCTKSIDVGLARYNIDQLYVAKYISCVVYYIVYTRYLYNRDWKRKKLVGQSSICGLWTVDCVIICILYINFCNRIVQIIYFFYYYYLLKITKKRLKARPAVNRLDKLGAEKKFATRDAFIIIYYCVVRTVIWIVLTCGIYNNNRGRCK